MVKMRRSAEETRELMVEAGAEILHQSGITIGLDHVTLEAVCRTKNIPRSSSHSAWAIDDRFSPQEAFRREVMKAWLFEREKRVFGDQETSCVAETVEGTEPNTPLEAIRSAVDSSFERTLRSNAEGIGALFSTDLAIRYAIASQPLSDRNQEMLEWLNEGEQLYRDRMIEDVYRPLVDFLGYVPRPEFGKDAWSFFSVVVASLVEGVTLRAMLLPDLDFAEKIVDTEGPGAKTTALSALVEATLRIYFEPAASS